ncbi:SEL1-like repeat protein [Snodgrassella communis]
MFSLAVAQNEAKAQYSLGVMYYLGKGVKQDYIKAFNYFQLAAE